MKVVFLGNCQINAMRGICREMHSELKAQFFTITPYWGTFDEPGARAALEEADVVVSQAIANPTTTFNVEDVRATTRGELVFMPYVYVDGIAGLEIIASKGRSVLKGAEPLLEGQDGRKRIHIFQDYCEGRIDLKNQARVDASLARMAEKEAAHCDVTISDYIAETYRERETLYGINHPAQHVVFELYRRLCARLGWSYDEAHARDPVAWARRALPRSQRAFAPHDVAALGLSYPADTHWYGQGHKMLQIALKRAEEAGRPVAA